MGIRFWCPNGHKLHVKSFLAGKRGICPECGVKVIIPQESQMEPAEADLADFKAAAAQSDVLRSKVVPPPEPKPAMPPVPERKVLDDSSGAPRAAAAANRPAEDSRATPVAAQPIRAESVRTQGRDATVTPPGVDSIGVSARSIAANPAPVGRQSLSDLKTDGRATAAGVLPNLVSKPLVPPVPGPMPLATTVSTDVTKPTPMPMSIGELGVVASGDVPDPFAMLPSAVWFVRPPQGGQYGPASSAVMKTWVEDGRVPPESHVWAEGWPEWRRAIAVVPASMLEAAGKRLQGAVTLTASTDAPTASIAILRRRKTRRWSATVVALLCVLCAILFVALIYVIKFMN